MIAVAAAILVAVNVGVFMAAGSGVMSPINNMLLWGSFVALNVASILWAVSLLGLQPLVVSISYVAGGALAFLGVRGLTDISVAEITTAGATYGAFGALAVGNATTKVRLAFFNKGQVPFIFIIVGLLVLDAGLNSQVSSAGVSVLLNAVVIPFVIAGVILGLIWSVLNRFGIGKNPREVLAEKNAALKISESVNAVASKTTIIPMPEHAVAAEKPVAAPQPVKKVEPIAPAAKAKPAHQTKKETVTASKSVAKEEPFFPLEIDKGDEIILPVEQKSSFEVPAFDAALYASGSQDNQNDGGVMVKEPVAAVEAKPAKPAAEPAPVVAEAQPTPKPVKEDSGNDWLGGHLDLLSKLK